MKKVKNEKRKKYRDCDELSEVERERKRQFSQK